MDAISIIFNNLNFMLIRYNLDELKKQYGYAITEFE